MIEYLNTTYKGIVSKHSEHFDLQLDTTVHFDENLMKWTVVGVVKLIVTNYTCTGNPIFIFTVNGEDKSNYLWKEDVTYSSGEYILGSFTSIYSASFKDDALNIYASFNLEANEEGPGTCVIDESITLPSVLNASGIMLVDNAGDSNVVLRVINMAQTIGYTRTLEFYYKKSTDTYYTFLDREVILSDTESYVRYLGGVVPGVSYDFKCIVYTCTGEELTTLQRTFVTSLKMPRLDVLYRTTTDMMIKLTEIDAVVNYERLIDLKYRVRGSLDWTKDQYSYIIAANDYVGELIFNIEGLEPGTNYEFNFSGHARDTLLFSKSIFSNTASSEEELDYQTVIVTDGKLDISIRNPKLNSGEKTMVMYVQDEATKKYHFVCLTTSTFFKNGYEFTITPDVSAEIKHLISAKEAVFKLIFSDPTTNIVEDIRYVIGG